jgi:hypothetical protein
MARILVNADAEHARVLRDRTQQPAYATALSEVLINDHIWEEAQARRHVHVADAVRLVPGAADEHGVGHRRRARRCSGDHAAIFVDFADALEDRRTADLAG